MEVTWMEERMGRRLTYKERVDLASEEPMLCAEVP